MSGQAEQIADAVLHELKGHGGFDSWWDDLHPLTQAEIKEGLTAAVTGELAKPKQGWGDSGPKDHNLDVIARRTRGE